MELLRLAVEAVEAECVAAGLSLQWKVLNERFLHPFFSQTVPPSYHEIAARFPDVDNKKIADQFRLGRERLHQWLRKIIASYAPQPEQVEQEWDTLGHILLQSLNINPEVQMTQERNAEHLFSRQWKTLLNASVTEAFEDLLVGKVCWAQLLSLNIPTEPLANIPKRADPPSFPTDSIFHVLHDPSPSLPKLRKLLRESKRQRCLAEGLFEPRLSTALHFSAAAAHFQATGDSHTRMSLTRLGEGLAWVTKKSWIDMRTQQLCKSVLKNLPTNNSSNESR